MGVRKTTDVLEKTTWTLAAIMVVLSVVSSYTLPNASNKNSVIIEESQKENQSNPQAIPGFDASQTTTPAADANNAEQPAATDTENAAE